MNYRQILPDPALRSYVRYFAVLEDEDHVVGNDQLFKIITDGYPGLIFQENANSFLDHQQEQLPQLFLHGIATRHSHKTARGNFHNVGVYFYEDALNTVFGVEAHELTDRHVSLDAICKTELSSLLLQAPSADLRIKIITLFLRKQVEKNAHKRSIGNLLQSMRKDPSRSLSDIQDMLQLSERGLERLFLKHVGLSPKLFSRVCRFQSSLKILRSKNFRCLTDVAFEGWYADQSHFIREFRQFAGATPRQFLRSAYEQAENFPAWIV